MHITINQLINFFVFCRNEQLMHTTAFGICFKLLNCIIIQETIMFINSVDACSLFSNMYTGYKMQLVKKNCIIFRYSAAFTHMPIYTCKWLFICLKDSKLAYIFSYNVLCNESN